jgi:ditrans,polycis-polyprenyl diphosphate synthase
VLNICFSYTSREEITQAVRSTVQEYSTPPRPQSTPFSQTRIKQKILSQQLDHQLAAIPETSSPSPSPSPSSRDDAASVSSSSTTLPPTDDVSPFSPPTSRNSGGGGGGAAVIYPNPETITAETLDGAMYTRGNPPLDIFIRTSGVERLSDFMLWQGHEGTHVFFLRCFWPEFDLWQFLPVLVEWQWRKKQRARDEKPGRRQKLQ